MHKNQLQELAQRSCFNLPSYSCIREGPDHAPRFKATVTFNGESFESPNFCSTLRQAEHAAAEVALNSLSKRGPTRSLAARILDDTGVCKNLLQETAQRACVTLPSYTTVRSGPGHLPVFVSTVELVGHSFTGESAKTKKQAEKNAAMAAWAALKQLVTQGGSSSQLSESDANEEEQKIIARALASTEKDEKSIRTHLLQKMHQSPNSQSEPSNAGQPGPTSSRIRIIPFTESSGQVHAGENAPYGATSFSSQSEQSNAGPSSSKVRITPLTESSGQACAVKKAPYSGTSSSSQSEPSKLGPTASRIRITPFTESSGQACTVKQAPYDATSSSSRSELRYTGSTYSRVSITPFTESSGRACIVKQAPYSSTAQLPMNMKADPSSGQVNVPGHQDGKAWVKSGSSSHSVIRTSQKLVTGVVVDASPSLSKSNTTSRIAAQGSRTVRVMPVQVSTVSLQPVIERHTGLLSLEDYESDRDEWFRGENSTIYLSTEGADFNSTDAGFALRQMSYNPVLLTHPDQVLRIETQQGVHPATTVFQSVTCLAPPVRVRQMVPVCSSPLHASGYDDQDSESKGETQTWQSLDQ